MNLIVCVLKIEHQFLTPPINEPLHQLHLSRTPPCKILKVIPYLEGMKQGITQQSKKQNKKKWSGKSGCFLKLAALIFYYPRS